MQEAQSDCEMVWFMTVIFKSSVRLGQCCQLKIMGMGMLSQHEQPAVKGAKQPCTLSLFHGSGSAEA